MLTLHLVNLGPIKMAHIDLEPLTVFVGPNNAGKSFVATATYAALSAVNTSDFRYGPYAYMYEAPSREGESDERSLQELLASDEAPDPAALTPSLQRRVSSWTDAVLYDYGRSVIRSLERGFGTSTAELRRAYPGVKSARLVIEDSELDWRVTISVGTRSTRAVVTSPSWKSVLSHFDRTTWRRVRHQHAASALAFPPALGALHAEVSRVTLRRLRYTIYMPAARSGLMQSQRAIAGAVVRRASMAGIEDVRVPALSGVVADFLSRLITLPSRTSDLYKESDRLEHDLLHGHIAVVPTSSGAHEIIYRTPAGNFPIHRTSSMISELAPVVLMLRTTLDRGDTLIIEEPEAHLHPATQVAFAQSLARLVNQDLQVVLTTHSEFFLQQLNNAILASRVRPTVATKVGLRSERLNAARVSAYLFEPGQIGTAVRRLAVTPGEGIPESGFASVAESLYNQTVTLDRAARRG